MLRTPSEPDLGKRDPRSPVRRKSAGYHGNTPALSHLELQVFSNTLKTVVLVLVLVHQGLVSLWSWSWSTKARSLSGPDERTRSFFMDLKFRRFLCPYVGVSPWQQVLTHHRDITPEPGGPGSTGLCWTKPGLWFQKS